MIIFAHRGASGHAPENTLLSIQTALDMGACWVEVDVFAVEGE
ncbi:MAG: glycerophosphodiester phosphodiesterase, partial [Deltaproteobacteria bacterium]|nr:glycerophosphodiester phosphodiesterase [Deltaproteobacteria bacterium]